jgi:hypothetical protein
VSRGKIMEMSLRVQGFELAKLQPSIVSMLLNDGEVMAFESRIEMIILI